MPLNIVPAVACMLLAQRLGENGHPQQALTVVWAGLAALMLMRFVTISYAYTKRLWMFKGIPRVRGMPRGYEDY